MGVLLLDRDAPEDLHALAISSHLLDLVQRVGRGVLHPCLGSVVDVLLEFDTIAIHDILGRHA